MSKVEVYFNNVKLEPSGKFVEYRRAPEPAEFKLSIPPPPANYWNTELAADTAWEKEKTHAEALRRLWQHALNSVDIRYPDPSVHITKDATVHSIYNRQTLLSLRLFNLRDTSDLTKRLYNSNGFLTGGQPIGWPGLYPAKVYITALWAIYMMHEAMELVTHKHAGPETYKLVKVIGVNGAVEQRWAAPPIVDAHTEHGYSQQSLLNTYKVAETMDHVLGPGCGRGMIERYKVEAEIELKAEISYLLGEVPREE